MLYAYALYVCLICMPRERDTVIAVELTCPQEPQAEAAVYDELAAQAPEAKLGAGWQEEQETAGGGGEGRLLTVGAVSACSEPEHAAVMVAGTQAEREAESEGRVLMRGTGDSAEPHTESGARVSPREVKVLGSAESEAREPGGGTRKATVPDSTEPHAQGGNGDVRAARDSAGDAAAATRAWAEAVRLGWETAAVLASVSVRRRAEQPFISLSLPGVRLDTHNVPCTLPRAAVGSPSRAGTHAHGAQAGSVHEASSSDEFVTPVSSHGPSPAVTPAAVEDGGRLCAFAALKQGESDDGNAGGGQAHVQAPDTQLAACVEAAGVGGDAEGRKAESATEQDLEKRAAWLQGTVHPAAVGAMNEEEVAQRVFELDKVSVLSRILSAAAMGAEEEEEEEGGGGEETEVREQPARSPENHDSSEACASRQQEDQSPSAAHGAPSSVAAQLSPSSPGTDREEEEEEEEEEEDANVHRGPLTVAGAIDGVTEVTDGVTEVTDGAAVPDVRADKTQQTKWKRRRGELLV